MLKHNKETPANFKQAFNHQANRFYGMFRISMASVSDTGDGTQTTIKLADTVNATSHHRLR